MLKTLLANVREYTRASVLAPLLTVGEVVMEVLIPIACALIIDRGIQAGDMGAVLMYGALMLLCALASLACGVLAGKYAAEASAGFAANLRDAMYENVQTFSFSNIDRFSTAGLVTRLTTDVTNVQNSYMMILRIAVRAPISLVSSIVACVAISAGLSLVFVVAIVVLAAAMCALLLSVTPVFDQVFSKYDELNAGVQENVGAIRVVKAFVREGHEIKRFRGAAERLYKLFVKAEGRMALTMPLMMLVMYAAVIALSWFGAQFVVAGSITTGELTSLFTYVTQILTSLMMFSMVFVMVSMSVANACRIVEVLDERPDITNPERPVREVADGSIDFDHVSFSYASGSGELVLSDIDLHIESGETIGIVGGTGSGKSTLVSLVSRLYDASDGSVRVGGRDVRDYDLETLRREVSVVLQGNILFSGTVLENLRWGDKDANEAQCREACELACADEFVEAMPEGYETLIERGGTNVSGGQRQRLCIARALVKRPRVLILDDSTSAVDTATDARIREAFATKIPDVTKLIISQRISSVADADRIIVLDEGRISGFGTHAELLETNDIYRDIYQAQTGASGDFDRPEED